MVSVAIVLVAIATALQGCDLPHVEGYFAIGSVDVPTHKVAKWRQETDIYLKYSYQEQHRAAHFLLQVRIGLGWARVQYEAEESDCCMAVIPLLWLHRCRSVLFGVVIQRLSEGEWLPDWLHALHPWLCASWNHGCLGLLVLRHSPHWKCTSTRRERQSCCRLAPLGICSLHAAVLFLHRLCDGSFIDLLEDQEEEADGRSQDSLWINAHFQ